VTIWLAVTHQDALVVDDYYRQGKAINQDLRRDRVATSLGLSFIGQIDAASDTLSGTLFTAGPSLTGKIRVHLAHPTLPEKDIERIALLDASGYFRVTLPLLDRAVWQILIEGEQRDWRLNGELPWPERKTITLAADVPPHD
jgi:hypothetical protein